MHAAYKFSTDVRKQRAHFDFYEPGLFPQSSSLWVSDGSTLRAPSRLRPFS